MSLHQYKVGCHQHTDGKKPNCYRPGQGLWRLRLVRWKEQKEVDPEQSTEYVSMVVMGDEDESILTKDERENRYDWIQEMTKPERPNVCLSLCVTTKDFPKEGNPKSHRSLPWLPGWFGPAKDGPIISWPKCPWILHWINECRSVNPQLTRRIKWHKSPVKFGEQLMKFSILVYRLFAFSPYLATVWGDIPPSPHDLSQCRIGIVRLSGRNDW